MERLTYMISTEYEKDRETRRWYTIGKGFDISQMTGKPLEERPQRSLPETDRSSLKRPAGTCADRRYPAERN